VDLKIRKAQKDVLKAFSKVTRTFALAGGTALELYYLHHRFSSDLDFFSPRYDLKEINNIVARIAESQGVKIKLQSEFAAANRARVRFYTLPVKNSARPLKIDFIEDVIFTKPKITQFSGVPVYSIENIYLQKIVAVAGTAPRQDEIGREVAKGRMEARDAFDIFVLSKKIRPLHLFLESLPSSLQRGMVHWYRSFPRQDMKLSLLDLDIYDRGFNAKEMISYLENEIKEFIKQIL
jgi:predicted nucleotidyltransferase component of viral defense system